MKLCLMLIALMTCGYLPGASIEELWGLSNRLHESFDNNLDRKPISAYIADCNEGALLELLIVNYGLEAAQRMKDGIPKRVVENIANLHASVVDFHKITAGVKSDMIAIEPVIIKSPDSGEMVVQFVSIKFAFGAPPGRALYEIVMPRVVKLGKTIVFSSGPISIRKVSN